MTVGGATDTDSHAFFVSYLAPTRRDPRLFFQFMLRKLFYASAIAFGLILVGCDKDPEEPNDPGTEQPGDKPGDDNDDEPGNKPNPDDEPGKINGHEYVDMGLPSGTKWATCNLGAEEPGDVGFYYSWGVVTPQSTYTPDDNPWFNKGSDYLKEHGVIDSKNYNLTRKYDAASANWGGTWRMPTYEELLELIYECSREEAEVNGRKGVRFHGLNGNSIFLPFGGHKEAEGHWKPESTGYYWGSKFNGSDEYYISACGIFIDDKYAAERVMRMSWGCTIRPVSN